jgi:hypothetical protein
MTQRHSFFILHPSFRTPSFLSLVPVGWMLGVERWMFDVRVPAPLLPRVAGDKLSPNRLLH